MKKQWIVGTALLMLMTGNAWADGEPPTENILKDQFKKQYHGILKLDAITLKNLDAKGNQATWSAEGDVSSSDDLYTWVGQLADYELLEQTWTKDKPVKFSAMLTSKGTPASGWSVNFYSFQAAASDRGRVVDDIKTNNKYLIVNSEDFNYRFSQLESALNTQKNSIPALEKEVKALDKQMVAAQKAADAYWGKDANGKQMTREDAFKKITNSVMSLINRTIARRSRLNMTKRFINRPIAACHKQSEECYEVPIQQKRDFDINEQRRQTFLQSQKLSRKLQDDWVTLEKGQYPLTMKVSEINSKKSPILMKIDDINQANERWKKDTEQLRRNGVIK
ncbi:putative alpha helix chain [Escherichia coli]|uniref:Putative alpha helix chain n=1 Tax=Escherichia coli TaxID=562 RepID=A0A377DNG5_ECOLX|nr:putative alpha helix chain [Escherichia coli]